MVNPSPRTRLPARATFPDWHLDDLCRDVVFARDGYVCQWCGWACTEVVRRREVRRGLVREWNSYDGLDWAHVYGRGRKSMQWTEDNVLCLCGGCHRGRWHGPDQGLGPIWFRERFPERAAVLALIAGTSHRIDRAGIALDLRLTLQRMIERGEARVDAVPTCSPSQGAESP